MHYRVRLDCQTVVVIVDSLGPPEYTCNKGARLLNSNHGWLQVMNELYIGEVNRWADWPRLQALPPDSDLAPNAATC